MKSLIFVLLVIVLFGINAQAGDDYFGEVTFSINDSSSQTYTIRQALIYRNVSLQNDTSIIVQNKSDAQFLYYPQLSSGTKNILRLIFGEEAGTNRDFYDLYIDLGDSLPDNISFNNDQNRIFLNPKGEMTHADYRTDAINGLVHIIQNSKNKEVAGNFDISFHQKDLNGKILEKFIKINGEFDVPMGKYPEISLSSQVANGKMPLY